MTIARRSFITGLISLVAAPAIVRAGSLMSVKAMLEAEPIWTPYGVAPGLEAARALLNYRNEIMREYFRANLFGPYLAKT